MAGNIDRILGARLLALQGRGGNFQPYVRAAARRLTEGTGTAADVQTVRQALGIKRSGAGAARREFSGLQRATSTIIGVTQSMEMISAGGNVAAAGALNLYQVGTREVDQALRSKALRTVVEKTTEKLLGNANTGAMALLAARRAFRVGTSVIGAAIFGWEVGAAFRNARDESYYRNLNAAGNAFNFMKKNNVSMTRARSEVRNVSADVGLEEGKIHYGLRRAGLVHLNDEIDRRLKFHEALMNEAREATAYGFGGRTKERILADYASRHGIAIHEMTEDEQQRALDDALEGVLNPLGKAGNQGIGAKILDDLNRDVAGSPEMVNRVDTIMALQNPWDKAMDYLSSDEMIRAKRRRIYEEEVLPARINYYKARAAERDRVVARTLREMTPAQRRLHHDQQQTASMMWNAARSRHKAWAND